MSPKEMKIKNLQHIGLADELRLVCSRSTE